MALIKCPECKKQISNSAKKCPNCGYRRKVNSNSKSIIKDVFWIIGMLGFASGVYFKNIIIMIIAITGTVICYGLLMAILDYIRD